MRYAFKTAYDGTCFHGSQRQPDQRTVEGDIIRVLEDAGAIDDVESARFQVASRTDRGVSALGNVIAFDAKLSGSKTLSLLNAKCSDMWFLGYAKVAPEFNPRHARLRHYEYLVQESGLDLGIMRETASLFKGEHDFSNFCKRDHRRTVREVKEVKVRGKKGAVTISFKAESFLWNQVRRMVSAILAVAREEVGVAKVERALAGKGEYDFGLVPPEPLVLWDVDRSLEMSCPTAVSAKIEKELAGRILTLHRKKWFLEGVGKMSGR